MKKVAASLVLVFVFVLLLSGTKSYASLQERRICGYDCKSSGSPSCCSYSEGCLYQLEIWGCSDICVRDGHDPTCGDPVHIITEKRKEEFKFFDSALEKQIQLAN